MITKKILFALLAFLSYYQCSYAQDTLAFKKFMLIGFSYSAEKKLDPHDSSATKKYTLVNQKGDTLFLFQKLPLTFINGEPRIYEVGLTEFFVHLKKDSCYDILFVKDTHGLLQSKQSLKHLKVDFWFRSGSDSSTYKGIENNFIINHVKQVPLFKIDKRAFYQKALDTLQKLLSYNANPGAFKQAVFTVENAWQQNSLSYADFDRSIQFMSSVIAVWLNNNRQSAYRFPDSLNFSENYAIYHYLKDTTTLIALGKSLHHLPYQYNFDDFSGNEDWSNMFVTKLLATHKGNCHSLPYLYKMLADELGTTCWLSLAPNHIYIKNRCKSFGWYNTELTSGSFPIDAWIMASGYLPLNAIQNAIYMDTLSNQQSIALCILDLAKGYEHKAHNYTDSFILKCCDLSLKYYPKNVQAMLLKAETLKRVYGKQQLIKDTNAKATYADMEQLYMKLFDLGYREMPDKMYLDWLHSVVSEKEKYQNKKVMRQ